MTARVEVSWVMDRPLSQVFQFMVTEHVRNYPRWDEYIELEQISDGPIRVGTMIRQWNSRSGARVEGNMEVIEFELDDVMGVIINDGSVQINSWIVFEAVGDNETQITNIVQLPGVDENADTGSLMEDLKRSQNNQRALMEAEL